MIYKSKKTSCVFNMIALAVMMLLGIVSLQLWKEVLYLGLMIMVFLLLIGYQYLKLQELTQHFVELLDDSISVHYKHQVIVEKLEDLKVVNTSREKMTNVHDKIILMKADEIIEITDVIENFDDLKKQLVIRMNTTKISTEIK